MMLLKYAQNEFALIYNTNKEIFNINFLID